MEGIAAVLRHAHALTTKLLQNQKWALMVRTYLMYKSIYATYYDCADLLWKFLIL
jgi:hypothetical protein